MQKHEITFGITEKLPQPRPSRNSIALYQPAQLDDALVYACALEQDQKKRAVFELKQIAEKSHIRPLCDVTAPWKDRVGIIAAQQPNFAAVIEDAVIPALSIRAAGGIARQAPILLYGPPGLGKTHFAHSLARMLQVPSGVIDMSVCSTSGDLTGLSAKWSNGAPGLLYRLLTAGTNGVEAHADPVIVIDELDKALSERNSMDPVGPLYSLLETETASQFQDEFLPGLHLDASHVRFIICCNSINGIPAPILSRCQIFNIRELTAEERRKVHRSIFANTVSDCGLRLFDKSLPTDILESTLAMNTREFKNLCLVAVGRAVLDERVEVSFRDFRRQKDRPRIGFLDR